MDDPQANSTPPAAAPPPSPGDDNPELAQIMQDKQSAIDQRNQFVQQYEADVNNYDPAGAAGPRPTFSEPTPQDHFKDIMATAPLMMAMGAIGGKFGNAHGVAMLQSTNAMMKGITTGSDAAYQKAREDYDQKYRQFSDQYKTWMDVYKAYSTAYKGRIDADQRAITGANASVGVLSRDENFNRVGVAKMAQLKEKYDELNAKVSNWDANRPISQQKADAATENARAHTTSAGASAANAVTNQKKQANKGAADDDDKQYANSTIDDLDKLLKENSGLTGIVGAGHRAAEWVATGTGAMGADEAVATKFDSKNKFLEGQIAKLIGAKSGRLNAQEKKTLQDAYDGFRMTSGPQKLVKLQELRNAINKTSDQDTKTINGVTYRKDPSAANGWRVQQ